MLPLSPLPPLSPGDTVAVLAPAGVVRAPFPQHTFSFLQDHGLHIHVDPRTFHVDPQSPYLAGTDAERVQALHDAIQNPDVRAIWCARGGYGSMRILPLLNPDLLRANPKPILGFSDITALLSFSAVHAHVPAIHAPLFKTIHTHLDPAQDPFTSSRTLLNVLLGHTPSSRIDSLTPLQSGSVTAPIVGGNLALVCSLLTTPWSLPLQGSILYLEDVHESPYRLDRMLTTLALGGHLSSLAGLVLGDLDPVPDAYLDASNALPCVLDRVRELARTHIRGPVAIDLPIGHGARNIPLPFGTLATLDVSTQHSTATLHVQHAIAAHNSDPKESFS